MSEQGKIRSTYTSKGRHTGYAVEVRHRELNKYQVVRGDNKHVVQQKARAKMAQWDEMWQRKQEAERKREERAEKAQYAASQQQLAVEQTQEAQDALSVLEHVLSHTLSVDDTVDWESLKDYSPYAVPQPERPKSPNVKEPQLSNAQYHVEFNLLDMLIASRKTTKEQKATAQFKRDHQKWEAIMQKHAEEVQEYEASLATWEEEQAAYLQARDASNAAIDEQKADYLNSDSGAVLDYCDLVLLNSEYPDYFPQSYELDYNPENRILVVDYQFPSITDLPTLQEVKYIKSRDEFTEKHISQTQVRRNFDSVLYQITLRTIHELYEADQVNALASIVFNGYTHSIDPATGREVTPCVLSVQAGKEEFEQIQLANIDPKICFKGLKGIGSTRLHSLTPVAPILRIEREDARFTDAYAVVDGLEEGDNLAAMDWEDFEHLIREVFEEEFGSTGGEVKVTRASRDGGVDAIAFDPDPIHGGKIVIQAKRYTSTVGVSFVRDLYGTVMNEGANKGIIVTTSTYGPDAYEFAKGKPLVLIDGSNLLHLLEKHGHKARIDLREAKELLADK